MSDTPVPPSTKGAYTESIHFPVKPLDDKGRNFQTWQRRMMLLLRGAKVWDVVDPAGSPMPTNAGQELDAWLDKDIATLLHINCHISDTAMLAIKDMTHARDAWKALLNQYNGAGAQDASIISARLHHYQMDDSKSLESQINAMCELHAQLASLGDEISDPKFAMILSEALPPSYDMLKSITIATISEVSNLNMETLIRQILCEEKQKQHQTGVTAMLAKLSRLHCQDSQKTFTPMPKLNTTSSSVQCMNPKCSKTGHSFEQCWTEGGGAYKGRRRGRGGCLQALGSSKDSAKVATSSDVKL